MNHYSNMKSVTADWKGKFIDDANVAAENLLIVLRQAQTDFEEALSEIGNEGKTSFELGMKGFLETIDECFGDINAVSWELEQRGFSSRKLINFGRKSTQFQNSFIDLAKDLGIERRDAYLDSSKGKLLDKMSDELFDCIELVEGIRGEIEDAGAELKERGMI